MTVNHFQSSLRHRDADGGGGGGANDPHIDSIDPNTWVAGNGQNYFNVLGSNFNADCTIEIDNVPVATVWEGMAFQITADWTPTVPGTFMFTVRNTANDEESNSVPFTVT